MAKPTIALIVDHPERDLPGLALAAYDLCQRGAICYLVPYNLQEQEVFPLAPDFVLLNFIREGNDGFARRMAEAGIRFGSLDTEGGVWPSPDHYSELIWRDASIRQRVSCLCIWGPKLAGHLVDKGLFDPKQIAVTGCPRFDLYKPMWRSMFSTYGSNNGPANARGRCNSGKILINTNYSFSNPKFASIERNIQLFIDTYRISRDRVEELIANETRAIESTIELVKKLAADYAAADLLLRPHPFERADRYQQELSHLSNVVVDSSGPVQPQILRADVVIQRSCTTAIEAVMASVPTLSPQWISAPYLNPMAEAVSVPCATYDEMCSNVGSILRRKFESGASISSFHESVIHDWFYLMDGRAYRRVGDAVLNSLDGSRTIDRALCRKYAYGIDGMRTEGWDLASARLRHLFGLSPDWSFRRMRPVPFFGWTKSKKHFEANLVRHLIGKVHNAYQANGMSAKRVSVEHSREGNYCLPRFHSYSITLTCDQ